MSQELNKNNWRPTAKFAALKARAEFNKKIRSFFEQRNVMEVETPLMCARAITDPYIQAFNVDHNYLQTSPEYAMKRMLADGSGAIYQICKAFRKEEAGNFHNPEFTILEWYRPGFTHVELMDEMDQLMQLLLDCDPAIKISYKQLFIDKLGLNPLSATIDQLQNCAAQHNVNLTAAAVVGLTTTDWMQILMSHVLEPLLIGNQPWFVHDFPAAQAALAKVIPGSDPVAARFEAYMEGIELANGYYELQDSAEQAKRFAADNEIRIKDGIHTMQADERLIAALEVGIPDCAGVAVGLDRLLMLKLKTKNIADVLSFTIKNA